MRGGHDVLGAGSHPGDADAGHVGGEGVRHPGAGEPWGRSGLRLDGLVNPEDITRLVVCDTWTRNGHRHFDGVAIRRANYDGVSLSSEGVAAGRRRLIAMDHGLCFIRSGGDLTANLAGIDTVNDAHLHGRFAAVRGPLRADVLTERVARLRQAAAEARSLGHGGNHDGQGPQGQGHAGHRPVPDGRGVPKRKMDAVNVGRDAFHGEWNHTLSPHQT